METFGMIYINMRRKLITLFLIIIGMFNASLVFAEEEIEYRFDQLWPRQEQSWSLNGTSIAFGSDDTIYTVDSGNHRIQQFNKEGDFIRTWGHEGSGAGEFNHPEQLAVAPDGTVYVTDFRNHRVQQFSSTGDFIRQWGENGSEAGQFFHPSALKIAPDGSVYVGEGDRIQKFSAQGDFIQLWEISSTDFAIALDGSIYVADWGSPIRQFSAKGDFIRSWGSEGAEDGEFNEPYIAISPDGNIYVVEGFINQGIQKFTADGDFIQKWGSLGSGDGQFVSPSDIAIASDGKVYVVDGGIQQFTAQGQYIRTWGDRSNNGQLDQPYDVSVASDGSVYIADTGNHRVQQFSSEGNFIRAWGDKGGVFGGYEDGELTNPVSLATAPSGDVYVADEYFIHQYTAQGDFVRKWDNPSFFNNIAIDPSGNVYTTTVDGIIQFNAKGDFILEWGIDSNGEFNSIINGLAIASNGNVYVSDRHNHSIRQFNAQGGFIRKWGNEGNGDGQFNEPADVVAAQDGSIYVADSGNNRIQHFTADGEFIRAWGQKGSGDGQFNQPEGLAVSLEGIVYVADTQNQRIQKFVPGKKRQTSFPYKAIILAAGGETIDNRSNHIWDGTWRVAKKAYKALSRQGFIIHDEIKFLTAGNTQFDLDNNNKFDDLEVASKDNLRKAITEWASDAEDVVIFLANHGGAGKFHVNDKESLTAEELDSWVNQLDESIPGTITIAIEASNSGSFFKSLSKAKRNIFVSTEADQPTVISNEGLSSFSYFFWSKIGTGAFLKDAFQDARQAMNAITVAGIPQNAQADTDGNQIFDQQDLDNLGDYCLGNCNQATASAPVITPLSPNNRTLKGETKQDFSISVNHLQGLNRAWALIQRPDDISIDPNQPLNFEKITLNCDKQDICQGSSDGFNLKGEYRISFYAMDDDYEVSFPETLTITQNQGAEVTPVQYDEERAVVYLRDVEVNDQHLQVALESQGDKFVAIAVSDAPKQYTPAAKFDFGSGLLTIPHAKVLGKNYQATFKYLGELDFKLQSAVPKE